MKKILALVVAICVCMHALDSVVRAETINLSLPRLMISELQTGGLTTTGSSDGRDEFVELYNPSTDSLNITGWRLEYLSAGHTGQGSPTRVLAEFSGEVVGHGRVLVNTKGGDVVFPVTAAVSGLMAQGGGHVRIVDTQGETVDLTAWGNGVPVGKWPKIAEIAPGLSAQRILPDDNSFTDGWSYVVSSPTPQGGGLRTLPEEVLAPCELVLSEVLPNPAGADIDSEYIEVYNPTLLAQSMDTCALKIGKEGVLLSLPSESLQPGAYRAMYSSEIDFTLPNSTGSEIWLVGGGSESGVRYADGLADDVAWAYIEKNWQSTLLPTPGEANRLPIVLASTEGEKHAGGIVCPTGKERNPETNRCRNIPDRGETVSCRLGQIRNIETGRCRVVGAGTASSSSPCKSGQERNAETGRCRQVLTAPTGPKPCGQGQERSPETNRCRKQQAGTVALAKVEDLPAKNSDPTRWAFMGVICAGLMSYAVYEWRQDIVNGYKSLKCRAKPK